MIFVPGKSFSKFNIFVISAPLKEYIPWSLSPTTVIFPYFAASKVTKVNWALLVSWYSSTNTYLNLLE